MLSISFHKKMVSGDTLELAYEAVKSKIPENCILIKQEEIKQDFYGEKLITTKAIDEVNAKISVRSTLPKTAKILSIDLIEEGNKGLFGIGSPKNTYRLKIFQPFTVEITVDDKKKFVNSLLEELSDVNKKGRAASRLLSLYQSGDQVVACSIVPRLAEQIITLDQESGDPNIFNYGVDVLFKFGADAKSSLPILHKIVNTNWDRHFGGFIIKNQKIEDLKTRINQLIQHIEEQEERQKQSVLLSPTPKNDTRIDSIHRQIWEMVAPDNLREFPNNFWKNLGPPAIPIIKNIIEHPIKDSDIANAALLVDGLKYFADNENSDAAQYLNLIAVGFVKLQGGHPNATNALNTSIRWAMDQNNLEFDLTSSEELIFSSIEFQESSIKSYSRNEPLIFTIGTFFGADDVAPGTKARVNEIVTSPGDEHIKVTIDELGERTLYGLNMITSAYKNTAILFTGEWIPLRRCDQCSGWFWNKNRYCKVLLSGGDLLEGSIKASYKENCACHFSHPTQIGDNKIDAKEIKNMIAHRDVFKQ